MEIESPSLKASLLKILEKADIKELLTDITAAILVLTVPVTVIWLKSDVPNGYFTFLGAAMMYLFGKYTPDSKEKKLPQSD